MAIQFNCPSCGAMIRVPDTASGKKGTCPQCSEKLLVPEVVPATNAGASPQFAPAPVSRSSSGKAELPRLDSLEHSASGGRQPPDSSRGKLLVDPSPSLGFPDFAQPAARTAAPDGVPQLGLQPLAVSGTETSVGLALKTKASKKKRQGQGAWIVPVVCVVGFIGFLGWFFWKSQPKLEGPLQAHAVRDLEVQPGLIPGGVSGLSVADLGEVLRHLKAQPARWSSSTSRITLKGADKGVEVSIENGTASHFVKVEPTRNPAFMAYVTQHAVDLDKPRLASIAKYAPKLFAAWKIQFDKHESITDQKSHRDLVALPSLVTGVGYHLEAVVNGNVYPCVYEDPDGHVYFLLPNATKSFVLQGRRVAGGGSLPANFTVKLAGSVSSTAAKKSSKTKTKEEREADNEGMNPDLQKEEPDESMTDDPKQNMSEGEALKKGLTGMLSDDMSEKPASKSKTSPKKPGMMMKDDEMSEEMMDEMPAKSLPKKGTSKMMPKEAMDEEMMEPEGEMPAKPKPKPKAKKTTN